jgi:pimeloyl-ACP methyl ester carboxylesterase
VPNFNHDGLSFHYLDAGSGTPFIFQHGLGGDTQQTDGLYQPQTALRFISMDCRGHGQTRPLGDPGKLNFCTFADDVLELTRELGLAHIIIGGISMGAGLALNIAARFPDRMLGLILSRPAWLDRPMPENLLVLTRAASLIRRYGAQQGLEHFKKSVWFEAVSRDAPEAAESLAGQFREARAEEALERLERLPNDVPNRSREQWAGIRVPTLVLATRQDPVHPFEYGEVLARAIPGAVFKELTPKSVSPARYRLETQKHIGEFLHTHFAG